MKDDDDGHRDDRYPPEIEAWLATQGIPAPKIDRHRFIAGLRAILRRHANEMLARVGRQRYD